MTYNEAKLQQLNEAITYRVYGYALAFEEEGESEGTGLGSRKRWILIRPCFCVQDSPENPCQCNTGILWWLQKDAVVASNKSGRKDEHGKELQFFDVLVESSIMVESLQAVSVGVLKGLGRNASAGSVRNPAFGTVGGFVPPPGTGTSPKTVKEWVIEIAVGWLVDEIKNEIDQGTFWDGLGGWVRKHLE